MKIWQKLKENNPNYRRGYVIPVCIHCNVISGLMHADDYMRRGEYVCGTCQEEGPRKTFTTGDLTFLCQQFAQLVEYLYQTKR